jgi:hypothetical protein
MLGFDAANVAKAYAQGLDLRLNGEFVQEQNHGYRIPPNRGE